MYIRAMIAIVTAFVGCLLLKKEIFFKQIFTKRN